jgi:putative ABC transport system permease protein
MTRGTIIKRSLRYHWRLHLGVVLGAAIGSAALIGALIVGDSVRGSLRERALQRLGWVHVAMDLGDRLVGKAYYKSAIDRRNYSPGRVTGVLHSSGTAAKEDGTARANHIEVFGMPSFGFIGTRFNEGGSVRDSVILNEALAQQLQVKEGDEVILRVQKPTALSREAVISPQSDAVASLRLKVYAVTKPDELGNLSLKQNQIPPFNAFLDLEVLNRALGHGDKVNLMLGGGFRHASISRFGSWLSIRGSFGRGLERMLNRAGVTRTHFTWLPAADAAEQLNERMPPGLVFEAAGLSVRSATNEIVDLRTSRIFLDAPAVIAATNVAGQVLRSTSTVPVLTYLVNALQSGTNLTPYSMVTAAGAPYTPVGLKDDEIVINEWLARDLNVQPGAEIALSYFPADSASQLIERTNKFRVHSIVALDVLHGDRTLMPDFPGISKAESTHDWDAGFPLTHKIRPKDDIYWKDHRGTPKAFVTLAAGQKMWANRFGELTAIRWFTTEPVNAQQKDKFTSELANALNPADFGLGFQPVRDQALAAASQSQDFGGLFIGFSFFLILAALILIGLLFAFGLQQRGAEIGTFLAVGFRPNQVRKLFLLEGAALAFIGSILGMIGGVFYSRAMLQGLTTIWRSATNTSALTFHSSPLTLAIGLISGTLVATITIWLVLRKQARQPARALLAGEVEDAFSNKPASKLRVLRSSGTLALLSLSGTVVVLGWAFITHALNNPGIFFMAGSLSLIAGLALTSFLLRAKGGSQQTLSPITSTQLSVRGAGRRRMRSVATVALLACGVFLIAAIGAFRLDAEADAWKRSSGTGGFALIGESTLPIVKDLNTREGRDALGLDEKILQDVKFVPFRVRDGDDASCLNLNRAQQPTLLGVKPDLLHQRKAFSFSNKSSWDALNKVGSDIPAVGDSASIQWALHKKIGDTLSYRNERGADLDARIVGGLANSILQGVLIIDESQFTRHFPSVSGYRMFLIDCPSNALPQVSAELSRALQDYGFEITPAAQRLAAFNAVQNTYLNTFQVLGGLGLLLGSFGLGIVVLRNVLERRGELALLIAVGFRRGGVQKLVLVEHAALLCLGLVIGIVSAVLAVLPSLLSPRGELPVMSLALTLGGVFLFGMVSTWLATRAAIKGNLLEGLRNE